MKASREENEDTSARKREDRTMEGLQVRERSMDDKRDATLRTAPYLFLRVGYQKTSRR